VFAAIRSVVQRQSAAQTDFPTDPVGGERFHAAHERAGDVRPDVQHSQGRKPSDQLCHTEFGR